jgi:hypothetical protein
VTTLLEAYENSLKVGEGHGRRPSKVYAVEMLWRPGGYGRIKRWLCTFDTKASAVTHFEHMQKHPVENEEVRLLEGAVVWDELVTLGVFDP